MPSYSQETKQRVREAVKSGRSRLHVAIEFRIHPTTVYRWTEDQPKNEIFSRRLNKEEREEIRRRVMNGESRGNICRDFGVSYATIRWITNDLPDLGKGNRTLRPQSVNLLQKLITNGYAIQKSQSRNCHNPYRTLRNYFPIKRVQYGRDVIYFLEDKNQDALKGFIGIMGKRVMKHGELARLAMLFEVPLSYDMKKELIGKIEKRKAEYLKKLDHEKQKKQPQKLLALTHLMRALGLHNRKSVQH